jgi:hypothetical protein
MYCKIQSNITYIDSVMTRPHVLTMKYSSSGLSHNYLSTTRLDWQVAKRVVTYRRVGWAIDSFDLYKSPGMEWIFPALLQEGREVVVPYLVRMFRACLAAVYVPTAWSQVRVVFIPKPGRNTYSGPKDYRPISLTSFLLKTVERLVDRHLRDEMLALSPLHPNQHANQAGKSTETALHQLVVWVDKVLDKARYSPGGLSRYRKGVQ